jgi:hypothetical protein
MNPIIFHDPGKAHEYLSTMFFAPLRSWLHANGHAVIDDNVLEKIHNATVITNADLLNLDSIAKLKNNGCKIVAFSCTDSSYISQSCRDAYLMSEIDLIFALTGIQKVNEGHEMVVDQDFNISLEKREFLPEDDWIVFNNMRKMGRLQSLPYVHWTKQPDIPPRPYSERSQRVLIRGGNHARRFVLALMLMRKDLLDTNSGFVTAPYFAEDMNPQFRYCDQCRHEFHPLQHYSWKARAYGNDRCTSPAKWGDPKDWTTELGKWNNACPRSFYWLAEQFEKRHGPIDKPALERLLNAQWLPAKDHLEMLARITFTSDLKWLFSIYAAQRFWDAAMVGCVNVLPARSAQQEYFPPMNCIEHFTTYDEGMEHGQLIEDFSMDEADYNSVSRAARALYCEWIQATDYALNTNLLRRIFEQIERHCA